MDDITQTTYCTSFVYIVSLCVAADAAYAMDLSTSVLQGGAKSEATFSIACNVFIMLESICMIYVN